MKARSNEQKNMNSLFNYICIYLEEKKKSKNKILTNQIKTNKIKKN
jgi:hypothetical protein